MNTKQVIVIRKDLKMRKGKMCAQAAHASIAALLKFFDKQRFKFIGGGDYEAGQEFTKLEVQFGPDCILHEWLNGKFTKICVSVNSEKELLEVERECNKLGIPNALITDCGLTEFHGVPTKTCLGIGPFMSKEIDIVTRNLPLL